MIVELWIHVINKLKARARMKPNAIPAEPVPQQTACSLGENEMKRSTPTILSLILTMVVSTTAFAGNIAGGRATGNIAGGRAAGNIAGGRATGNIAGGRLASTNPSIYFEPTNGISRFNFESPSATFSSLIRMLLESGALL